MSEKITDEDFALIHDLRNDIARIIHEIGQITVAQKSLKQQMSQSYLEYEQTLVREKELVSEFASKYGIGTLNFETGEFIQETNE